MQSSSRCRTDQLKVTATDNARSSASCTIAAIVKLSQPLHLLSHENKTNQYRGGGARFRVRRSAQLFVWSPRRNASDYSSCYSFRFLHLGDPGVQPRDASQEDERDYWIIPAMYRSCAPGSPSCLTDPRIRRLPQASHLRSSSLAIVNADHINGIGTSCKYPLILIT